MILVYGTRTKLKLLSNTKTTLAHARSQYSIHAVCDSQSFITSG